MTTTYKNTSCNYENTVACLVIGEGLLHACISSIKNTNERDRLYSVILIGTLSGT